jgi:uncharacterized protein
MATTHEEMSAQENTQIVQELFAAFGRGDIAAVLGALTEDTEWHVPGPSSVPFAGTYQGPEQVGQFFAALGGAVEFEAFEPREWVAQDDKVIVLGYERPRARATGRVYDNQWAMAFRLRGGKISRLRIYEDTAAEQAALSGA